MKARPPVPVWLWVALGIGVLIFVPILWVALAHRTGLSLTGQENIDSLVATIGSTMGAIFTLGGLVVALVAILTQLTIEERIEKTFNNQLTKIEERADSLLEDHFAFVQATENYDWHAANTLANRLLTRYSSLRWARRAAAMRMSAYVAGCFRHEHVIHPSLQDTSLLQQSLPELADWVRMSMKAQEALGAHSVSVNPDVPVLALHWISEATRGGDDQHGELWAAAAIIYGRLQAYSEMLNALGRALANSTQPMVTSQGQFAGLVPLSFSEHLPKVTQFFRHPAQLLMLVYASPRNRARLQELGRSLGIVLPATETSIHESILHFSSTPKRADVEWFAIELASDKRYALTIVRIHLPRDRSDRGECEVTFARPGSTFIKTEKFERMDDLIAKTMERYLFICPLDSATS